MRNQTSHFPQCPCDIQTLTSKLKEQIIVKAEAVHPRKRNSGANSFVVKILTSKPLGAQDFCRASLRTPRQSSLSEGWGEGGYPQLNFFPAASVLKTLAEVHGLEFSSADIHS